ncbi:hypothetical protein [Streptomyces albidochromogenes]|uniref:hypothetical protein n=1 Tax=Streptomyces albidochromogenes TaxID=329524 RepID=UPI001ABF532F|nr:hypothetical protein [Streptomyces albidochromogenes]
MSVHPNLNDIQVVLGSALGEGGAETSRSSNIGVQLGIGLERLPGRARLLRHPDMITSVKNRRWAVDFDTPKHGGNARQAHPLTRT